LQQSGRSKMPGSKASGEAGHLSDFDAELKALCEKHEVVVLDQLVQDVIAQDFRINNLMQIDKELWQCNLRRVRPGEKDDFYEYGRGETPEDALLNAMYNAKIVLTQSHMSARKKLRR